MDKKNLDNQLTQFYPVRWFLKLTYKIEEKYLARSSKNIFNEHTGKIDLTILNPVYENGKKAFDEWDNIAWFFVGILIFNIFVTKSGIIFYPAFIMMAVFFLLKLVKNNYIYFKDKNNNYLVGIRISKNKQEMTFVNNLASAIKNAKNHTK